MATCDSLQPIVLLTDVMNSNLSDPDQSLSSTSQEEHSPNSSFLVEQTEPLNLCLGGSVLNNFTVIECCPNFIENSNFQDDDVIFVKEYKVKTGNSTKKVKNQKIGNKGEPRRNPVRKARDKNRFKEYTDGSFDEGSVEEAAEEENNLTASGVTNRDEDSEDWKIENAPKKTRQRRKVFNRKFSHKLGRKRKIPINEEEKKVKIDQLEALVESNLTLIKNFISDVKTLNELPTKDGRSETRTKTAIDIFKYQVILLTLIKESDCDVTKFISS